MRTMNKEFQVKTRLTKKQYDRIKNIAYKNEITISELVRRTLENAFSL